MGAARQLLRTWLTSSTHSASTGVGFGVTCQRAAASRAASTAQLEPVSRSLQGVTLRDLYKLSKGKLSIIVVATCAAGFVAGSGDVVDFSKLAATCVGTFGCSAAANALNQVYEVRNDGRMRRTMLRPLPAGRLSVAQALMFAAAAGIGGGTLLAQQVNPLTAALGVGNIALYAAVYTPLKQLHPINTWVGAVVGAIPPLMGWTAATGSIDPGGLFLAGVLYFWQLPHFMALAWMCREDYARGGHRMISLLDQTGRRTAGVALRNALALVPLGLCAVNVGVVNTPFVYESVALSLVFALSASAFFTRPSQQTARLLFRMSLIHLPLYLALFAIHRQPNDGSMTWAALRRWLMRSTEAAEQTVLHHVHGPSLRESGVQPTHTHEAMIFPFSPPMIVPCPYSTIKQSLGGGGSASAGPKVASKDE